MLGLFPLLLLWLLLLFRRCGWWFVKIWAALHQLNLNIIIIIIMCVFVSSVHCRSGRWSNQSCSDCSSGPQRQHGRHLCQRWESGTLLDLFSIYMTCFYFALLLCLMELWTGRSDICTVNGCGTKVQIERSFMFNRTGRKQQHGRKKQFITLWWCSVSCVIIHDI